MSVHEPGRRVDRARGVDAAGPDHVARAGARAPARHVAEQLADRPRQALGPAQEHVLPMGGVRPQRRRQRPEPGLELGEPRHPVAVDVEHEHAVGAHEAVVGLRPCREQGPDAVVVARVLEEPLAADRVLAGAAAGRALRAPARPVGVGAPHAEHPEPPVGEPQGRADSVLGGRARVGHGVGSAGATGRDVDAVRRRPPAPRTRARRPWTTRNEAWSRGVRHSARARSRKAASASSGMRMVIVGMPRLNVRSARQVNEANATTTRQQGARNAPSTCRRRLPLERPAEAVVVQEALEGAGRHVEPRRELGLGRPASALDSERLVRRADRAGGQLARAPRSPAAGHGGGAARPLGRGGRRPPARSLGRQPEELAQPVLAEPGHDVVHVLEQALERRLGALEPAEVVVEGDDQLQVEHGPLGLYARDDRVHEQRVELAHRPARRPCDGRPRTVRGMAARLRVSDTGERPSGVTFQPRGWPASGVLRAAQSIRRRGS